MIGFYNYTVWLTYIGMMSSVIGIFFAISGNPTVAIICLMFSGFCDMFDGIVARTKKDRTDDEKRYGIQLDSLSDVVCFCVLPAAIGYSMGASGFLHVIVLTLFALCGLIRLAYFNVTEETRQQHTTEKRKSYDGVPVTSSALTVPLLFCFRNIIGDAFPTAYVLLLLLNGAAFITPIKFKKPGKRGLLTMLILGIILVILILVLK